jgi:preprotein translocase subunit YajC
MMELLYKLVGIATAAAEGTAAAGTAAAGAAEEMAEINPVVSIITTLLPMVLIFVVFYFMLIRPQQKKDKQVKEMLNNLKVSDRVCTIGGIYGTITQIKDDTVTLAVGNQNMTMVIARWGIRSVEEVTIENDSESLN